ncbi:MAG: T9SS type A sorting domain-containing protein [Flavobacteriales bacterium]|nr:T9SS type A sorting domain-containing protein [Flavobacteriales bacterium]
MNGRSIIFVAFLFPTITHAVTVTVEAYAASCSSGYGYAIATAQGGSPPYNYTWSDGSSGPDAVLPPGLYSVTVTDNSGGTATESFQIYPGSAPPSGVSLLDNIFSQGLEPCQGQCNGGFRVYLPLQVGGYSFSTTPNMQISEFPPPFGLPANGWMAYELIGACPGQSVGITVFNECGTGGATITALPALIDPVVNFVQITGSCTNSNSGSLAANVAWEGFNTTAGWTIQAVDDLGSTLSGQSVNLYLSSPVAFQFFNMHPGDWVLRFRSAESDNSAQEACIVDIPFVVPDLGPDCGSLSGRAFVDANENCIQNTGEPNLAQTVVVAQPGDHYALTNASGQYNMSLPNGAYTVTTTSPVYQEHCGVSTTPFTLTEVQPNLVRNLADTSLVALDVMVSVASGPARPGFPMNMHILMRNLTAVLAGNATVTLEFDPVLEYVSATPAPASVSGNTLVWNSANLGVLQQRSFAITFNVPPDIGLLGTVLNSTATVSVSNPESYLTNNSFLHQCTVTAAYDPNDKTALTSSRESTETYFIEGDEWIDYTIRFQNTGTDTAFFIVITDTLPPTLDPASFIPGAASHAHSVSLSGQGILRWNFPTILLPDSNINEPLSHGFIGFRIRPRLPLLPGDEIINIANIYFDFNPPVITEPSVLVATTGTGVADTGTGHVLHIFPNPATDHISVTGVAQLERYRIHALDGRMITEGRLANGSSSISVRHLVAGSYILSIESSTGAQQARFIKH